MPGLSRGRSFWLCIAVLALSAGWGLGVPTIRVVAQSTDGAIDQAIVDALRWRSIGPDRGGRSIAVSGVKGRPREAYFGAVGGGLWKTDRRAARRGRRSPTARSPARRSAPSPSPSRIPTSSTSAWASRASAATSCRATASTSRPTPARRGRTSASRNSDAISKIRIHPTNPDIVFVADFGLYGTDRATSAASSRRTDGGKTLEERAVPRHQDRRRRRRDRSPAIPNVMFAALWEAYRVEYQMSSGGPGSGLFKSTDGGETWTRDHAQPAACRQGMVGKIGVAISGADSNRVYALVENDNGGLFSSDDAGATWKLINDGAQRPPARVLLHARLRRSRTTRTSSTC